MSVPAANTSVLVTAFLVWCSLCCQVPTLACQDVLASRNDNARTGANLNEKQLNIYNVNPRLFGQLFSYAVQGNIFAQPLIVNGVQTSNGVRNIVYVATSDDVVYAFDAESNTWNGGLIWSRNLAAAEHVSIIDYDEDNFVISAPTPIMKGDPAHTSSAGTLFQGNLGIIGTPVIDRRRNTMYLVARSKAGDKYVQNLHALDITNGRERAGSPHQIASDPLEDPDKRWVTFAALQNQRAGLALVNDRVVVAWGSGPWEGREIKVQVNTSSPPKVVTGTYYGYVMAFDADTLAQKGCFTTGSPTTSGAGIWQSGRAPVVDSNSHVYFFTGNGFDQQPPEAKNQCVPFEPFPLSEGPFDDSLIELNVNKTDVTGIYFEPPTVTVANVTLPSGSTAASAADYRRQLRDCDVDLGGSGPMLVPGTTVLVGGGKAGFLHVFDRTGRKYEEVTAVRTYPGPTEDYSNSCNQQGMHHVMGGPVFWQNSTGERIIYVSVETDFIRAFKLTPGPWNLLQIMQNSQFIFGHPAAILSLSANNDQSHTAILWASHADRDQVPAFDPARYDKAPGILRAYDAENLGRELWNSNMCGSQDQIGYFAKFTPPTVANGKVYMATFSGKLIVYGVLPRPRACPPAH